MNATRKIFRFKYEPCLGTCYAWGDDDDDDRFKYPELGELQTEESNKLIQKMVDAHDSTCDDLDQSFGVDFDEKSKLYLGYFRDKERTHLFSTVTFVEMVNTLCDFVSEFNKNKGISEGICVYGTNGNENLFNDIKHAI